MKISDLNDTEVYLAHEHFHLQHFEVHASDDISHPAAAKLRFCLNQ